jgi:hypothetical protein
VEIQDVAILMPRSARAWVSQKVETAGSRAALNWKLVIALKRKE